MALMAVLAVSGLIIVLVWLYFRARDTGAVRKAVQPAPLAGLQNCPICRSPLPKGGLKAKSISYPDGRVMLEIRGCAVCASEGATVKRYCPSCRSQLAPGDVIMALSRQTPGRHHVRVQGCRYCYKR